jgi:hypothetical protein
VVDQLGRDPGILQVLLDLPGVFLVLTLLGGERTGKKRRGDGESREPDGHGTSVECWCWAARIYAT